MIVDRSLCGMNTNCCRTRTDVPSFHSVVLIQKTVFTQPNILQAFKLCSLPSVHITLSWVFVVILSGELIWGISHFVKIRMTNDHLWSFDFIVWMLMSFFRIWTPLVVVPMPNHLFCWLSVESIAASCRNHEDIWDIPIMSGYLPLSLLDQWPKWTHWLIQIERLNLKKGCRYKFISIQTKFCIGTKVFRRDATE